MGKEAPSSTLAPATLANPPAPTNLSKAAVIIGGERGIGIGRSDATGGMPSGMMANLWGSTNWGYINRFERGEVQNPSGQVEKSTPPSPKTTATPTIPEEAGELALVTESSVVAPTAETPQSILPTPIRHQKTISLDAGAPRLQKPPVNASTDFPANYPLALKIQEAQFKLLFPNVPREDKVVLVFRATWNPNEEQEFPGRAYVTPKDIYFYSHHLGLVLISGINLKSIIEVTAAPGKDCDFIFLHVREDSPPIGYNRITIKTFLEPLKLLQRRLNVLVRNANSEEPLGLQEILRKLISLEKEDPTRSPSVESWEDVSISTPVDDSTYFNGRFPSRNEKDLRTQLHVEGRLYDDRGWLQSGGKQQFVLPANPVVYEPKDMQLLAVEKQFDVSPKALFHVMFGDKSAVFQILYHERSAHRESHVLRSDDMCPREID
jgi:hypothetical protein